MLARRAQGPGFGDRRPAGPVNTACVIRIGDVRRVWEEGVGGKVPFEVAGGEVYTSIHSRGCEEGKGLDTVASSSLR